MPLREGGYALGVVARKGKGGVLFGYFFGPRRGEVPTIDDARGLSPDDAVLAERFGDLGIRDRTWSLLGPLETWERERWSIPALRRTESLTGRSWKVVYGDDPGTRIREEPCSAEVASRLRPNALAGAGAVEIALTELLRGSGTT